MPASESPQFSLRRPTRRAFSLIEMIVVIGIIGVVIAIVLPAVSGARRAARRAATLNTLNQLSTASITFQTDTRRRPGYFSIRDVAAAANTNGFTWMDNIMIDLMGGITQAPVAAVTNACDETAAAVGPVGPSATVNVRVDFQQIGGTKSKAGVVTKGYLQLDRSVFKRQCIQNTRRVGNDNNILAMPTVVDAFGQPILAWAEDDLIAPDAEFASKDYSERARFYWQTNRGFLRATGLGETGENQTNAEKGSLVSEDNAATYRTLEGVFGSPSSPNTSDPTKAADSRGKLIFHTAGWDGIYLGRKERGGKLADPANGLPYQPGRDVINDGSFDDQFLTVPLAN